MLRLCARARYNHVLIMRPVTAVTRQIGVLNSYLSLAWKNPVEAMRKSPRCVEIVKDKGVKGLGKT